MIEEHRWLVKMIAEVIASRMPMSVEVDDLISAGMIGLMDAAQRFDPTLGYRFETFATIRIRGSILDQLRREDPVRRSARDKRKMFDLTQRRFEAALGRLASNEDLAQALGMSMDEYHDFLNEIHPTEFVSVEDLGKIPGEEDQQVELSDDSNVCQFKRVESKEIKELIREEIDNLPERERLVISLYYYEGLNMKEIGQVMRVTESRASQLRSQAVGKLRKYLSPTLQDAA